MQPSRMQAVLGEIDVLGVVAQEIERRDDERPWVGERAEGGADRHRVDREEGRVDDDVQAGGGDEAHEDADAGGNEASQGEAAVER